MSLGIQFTRTLSRVVSEASSPVKSPLSSEPSGLLNYVKEY